MKAGKLRFFASGEYGEKNQRPHYHAIMYGTEDPELVDDAWSAGHTKTDRVTAERISYVAGYTSKKVGWPQLAAEERIDYNTGEIYKWQPPFTQMSRRPGIGGHARQWHNSWRLFAVNNGTTMPVPRFLHDAWKAQATPQQMEDLDYEKAQLSKGKEITRERLQAAEMIAIAYQRIQGERRQL